MNPIRVHVLDNLVFGIWVIFLVAYVLGEYFESWVLGPFQEGHLGGHGVQGSFLVWDLRFRALGCSDLGFRVHSGFRIYRSLFPKMSRQEFMKYFKWCMFDPADTYLDTYTETYPNPNMLFDHSSPGNTRLVMEMLRVASGF